MMDLTKTPLNEYGHVQTRDGRPVRLLCVEAKQILQCLKGEGSLRWGNHPAVQMWRGHESALAAYGFYICLEWRQRGYRDTLKDWFLEQLDDNWALLPSWMGDEAFHLSHQSNLVRKLPEHYAPLFPGVGPDLPYIWPKGDLA